MTTIQASYLPGTWVAVSAPGAWLLVDLPAGNQTVQRCWSLLSEGAGVDEVLDALVASGIRAMPSFALVRLGDDERRAVVRGAASVVVTGPDHGVTTVTADARTPWADDTVDPVAELVVLSGGDAGSDVELPMAAGVTMAASVSVRAAGHTPATGSLARSPTDRQEPGEPAEPEAEAAAPAEPDVDTPSYDFLFGATQRPLPAEVPPVPAPAETAGWHTVQPMLTGEEPEAAPDEPDQRRVDMSLEAADPPPGLIDALPWAPAVPKPPSPPTWTPPVPAPPPAQMAPTTPSGTAADESNDAVGQTTDRASLRAAMSPPIAGPAVLAGYCPAGHLSPAHAAVCRVCHAAMPQQQAFEIARPPLGVLRLSTGDVVTLDRGVLLGRAPTAPDSPDERPHVLRLPSPENDVSRSHAEVVLDGWNVYVRDLGSTNGTTVTLPGQQPVRLRENDLQLLEPGAVVTLADEVSATFEVTG